MADVEKAQEEQQTIRHSPTAEFFKDPKTYYTFTPLVQFGILIVLSSSLREISLDCSANSLSFAILLGIVTGLKTLLLQYIIVFLISFEANENPSTAEVRAYREFLKAVVSFWPWLLAINYTAGPSYDTSTHQVVAVNGPDSARISSEHCTANVNVRIQNYRGLPLGSPTSSPYFSSERHTRDQYSIAFTLIPRKTISGDSLVFGNDFDYPIRDRLPPGSGTALHIVRWAIDPGLDGDVYSDKPHLYGPLLSSIDLLRVCDKVDGGKFDIPAIFHEDGISEGGIGEGEQLREAKGVPADPSQRKKWFLSGEKRKDWEFEAGRVYQGDFFNPYIDFNDFSLKLPGFSLSVLGYIGKQDSLRYVLKNRDTGDVFFVVVFTLVHKEDAVEKDKNDITPAENKGKESKADSAYEPKADDVD